VEKRTCGIVDQPWFSLRYLCARDLRARDRVRTAVVILCVSSGAVLSLAWYLSHSLAILLFLSPTASSLAYVPSERHYVCLFNCCFCKQNPRAMGGERSVDGVKEMSSGSAKTRL
jgi:hypothetical protein